MNNVKVVVELSNATVNAINATNYGTASSFHGGKYRGSALENNQKETNAFIVGSTPVGGGLYMSRYGGYIAEGGSGNNAHSLGGYWVDNGVSQGAFAFAIAGSGITKVSVQFDREFGVYATVLTVNGETVQNDSFEFEYSFDSEQSNVVIGIVALSEPMKPVAVVNMRFVDTLEYTQSNGLKSVEIEHRVSTNAADIEYGIMSGGGAVEFVDRNGDFERLILSGRNLEWVPIAVFVDGNKVGQFYSQRVWQYNKLTNVAGTELQEVILKWQNVNVQLKYDGESMTAMQLVEFLMGQSDNVQFEIDSDTRAWLSGIVVEYPYLERTTLWEQWNKMCNIGQLVVYLLTNGVVCVKRLV